MQSDKIYVCIEWMPVEHDNEMCDDRVLYISIDHGQPVACLVEEHLLVD